MSRCLEVVSRVMLGHGRPFFISTMGQMIFGSAAHLSNRAGRWLVLVAWVCLGSTPSGAQELELGNPQAKKPADTPATLPASNKEEANNPVAAPTSATASSEILELNLRLAWGGGKARAWEGQVQLSQGTLQLVRALGMEADQSRALIAGESILHVQQLAPNTFHGMDIAVRAPRTATLLVILKPTDSTQDPRTLKIPISSLIRETTNATLDQQGNRIQIHRAPGDQLRLQFRRDSLVFSPQESFPLTVTLHQPEIAPGTTLRCEIEFRFNPAGKTITRSKHEMEILEDGSVAPLGPLTFEMPDDEGVYDLVISLHEKSLTDSFLPNKPLLERSLQLVVIASEPEAPEPMADFSTDRDRDIESPGWSNILSLDPANPSWWNRVKQMRQFNMIPGMGNGPLNNGKARLITIGNQSMTRLDPGGWIAYPIPVESLSQPHLLELDYPQDRRQTLGISIIDPNLAGKIAPIGLDSGIDVTPSHQDGKSSLGMHRLPFWPRTKTPWVLMVNRHPRQPAVFGKIRILEGSSSLPMATSATHRPGQRRVTAYFDKPLFPENFGAQEGIDPTTRSSLDNWMTFYQGGDRLTRYLRFAGYNAAVVPVMCEGATLYPSTDAPGTPKYDSGIFFTSGQDPIQKDVLEMLLRKFDQRGLTLIPAIQFSSPLPALEKQLHADPANSVGIELTGPDGSSWVDTRGTRRGMAPYYNPLDARVQEQMQRILDELVTRYQHHPSFGGIAIQMNPESYTQLPGADWGVDSHTLARFLEDTPEAATVQSMTHQERIAAIQGSQRNSWLNWRSQQLAGFYQAASKHLQAKKPGSHLYLVTSDLVNGNRVRRQLQPKLPQQYSLADVLLEMGIDHQQFDDSEHLVLVRPQRIAPVTTLPAQSVNLAMEQSSQVDQMFANDQHSSELFYHEPQSFSLPGFDQKSPFGVDNTQTWLVSHFTPTGQDNARRIVHAIATSDIQTLMLGGWMLPVGQEDSLRNLFTTIQHLPMKPFKTVKLEGRKQTTQPVVVRTLQTTNETFIYLANDSSWPVEVEVQLDANEQCLVIPLGNHAISNLQRSTDATRWNLSLKPHDLVAASFTSGSVRIQDIKVRYQQEILEQLRQDIYELNYRVSGLNKPQPMQVLSNAGFELPRKNDRLPGWVHDRKGASQVQLDRDVVLDGRQSLRLQRRADDKDVVWVRSQPFPPPRTGRIAISAWLKVKDAQKPPSLRLAIEGRHHGKVYYRPKTVGTPEPGNRNPAKPIHEKWTEFLLLVDDLPTRGLTELRVGFDLMSEGEVWIDSVKVYDLWFQESEKRELLKHIALAYNQRSELKIADCEKFLTSYWAQFLVQHVPLESSNSQPEVTPAKSIPVTNQPSQPDSLAPPEKPSMLERVREWIPGKVFPF